MNIATNRRRVVEKGSGNVYVDLSNHDAEAMLFKAQLVRRINGIIEKRALTLKLTARIAGLSPAKLAPILRGKFRRIDEAHLLVCLTSLKNYDDLKENFARLEADLKDWQGKRTLTDLARRDDFGPSLTDTKLRRLWVFSLRWHKKRLMHIAKGMFPSELDCAALLTRLATEVEAIERFEQCYDVHGNLRPTAAAHFSAFGQRPPDQSELRSLTSRLAMRRDCERLFAEACFYLEEAKRATDGYFIKGRAVAPKGNGFVTVLANCSYWTGAANTMWSMLRTRALDGQRAREKQIATHRSRANAAICSVLDQTPNLSASKVADEVLSATIKLSHRAIAKLASEEKSRRRSLA